MTVQKNIGGGILQEQAIKQRPLFLINPAQLEKQSSINLPVGLANISAILKKTGYKPHVIDLLFENDFERIENLDAKNGVYILSFSTTLVDRVKKIISIIRSKDQNSFIMGGGAHPTARKEKTFDDLDVDLIALGEVKIDSIIDALHNDIRQLSQIKGIMYKLDGKININEPVNEWENLDDVPIPDLLSFPVKEYFRLKGVRELGIVSSRGCPYRCTFCQPILISLFGPKVRFASAKRTVDEIEYMVKNFKPDFIFFQDDTFAFHQQRVVDICKEIIKRKIPILWRCQTRVGLKRDVLEWMKRAGCFVIAFGVESGSQKILDNVNKQATVEMIIDTFKDCKDLGILTHAYLMIGNVGESKETINETIELIKKIKPFSYNISVATPYPGTYLYEYAKANNIFINPEWSEYDHILGEAVAKFSDFGPEELLRLKKEMEVIVDKESERLNDLFRLINDGNFLKRMTHLLFYNPGTPFRMLKILLRTYIKKGAGFRVLNPMTKA
ncbi:radical SAM protein [Candidatus Woesearchaeota archaeon]|nr:radical SAM protein [Candidatus Woesearchaeota archaeon]